MNLINDFIYLSKYAGMRCDLIQAGGGNSSVKISDKQMLIKSSGIQLSDLKKDYGYSTVDFTMISSFMEKIALDNINISEQEILKRSLISGMKPSIETFLHAVTKKFTLHTHSTIVDILASRAEGMLKLESLFPDSLIVQYESPGLPLAKEYFIKYKKAKNNSNNDIHVIFLKNHGLIVTGETADFVIDKTEKITKTIEKELNIDYSSYHMLTVLYNYIKNLFQDEILYKVENKIVLDYYQQCGYKLWNYQISPDCIVYCGKKSLKIADDLDIHQQVMDFSVKYGNPILFEYKNNIYIKTKNIKKAKEIEDVLAFSSEIAKYNKECNLDLLNDKEQNFLLNWDAEKYRQNIK